MFFIVNFKNKVYELQKKFLTLHVRNKNCVG